MTEHDSRFDAWFARQGPRAGDLQWRLAHLSWRHRVLLRRYPVQGLTVLDYGCGDGVFAAALSRLGASVVGYDVSTAAIAQAEQFSRIGAPFSVTTAEPDPHRFDIVFCTEVLEHAEDDRGFIAGVAERARPGGRLIGTTPVGRAFWDPDHKRVYDRRLLEQLLTPLGDLEIRRYYRTWARNLLPWEQRGAAVFIFRIERRR
jgi:2-polyprenyl-3-methyl-5-hydroxy-6-metoxy-1,4-benzoquinol methylase